MFTRHFSKLALVELGLAVLTRQKLIWVNFNPGLTRVCLYCTVYKQGLWLAVCFVAKFKKYIYWHALNKIYLYSRHHFTSSNCIFMQLQGIVFVQLRGNDIVVNFQGNRTRYIRSSKSYSFKFKEICSFKESIFIQQRCVPGHSRNIYSTGFPSHFNLY